MVPEHWVLNASPLIVLARIGQAELVTKLAEEVVVPRAVATEIRAGPAEDPARHYLETGHLPIVDVPAPPANLLAWDLGRGETAVLAYALANPGCVAIVDDKIARKCARSFSISLKGTLGVILLARQQGVVPSATDLLRQLRRIGFRLDDQLIEEALRTVVGEEW